MEILNKMVNKMHFCFGLSQDAFFQMLRFRLRQICLEPICKAVMLSFGVFSVGACNAGPEMVSAPITGYNHTSASIIRFSVNGAGGPHILPNQGGGEVCCGVLPVQWKPGIRAIIEWDKDPSPYKKLKRDKYGQIIKEEGVRHAANYSHHSATVEVPRYAEKVCALQVHFLPCDDVKISTTCFTPGNPNYPDKAYFQIKEPASCSNH